MYNPSETVTAEIKNDEKHRNKSSRVTL